MLNMPDYQERRDWKARYDALHTVFCSYMRRFSLIDIGANQGYIPLTAAAQYGCVSVLVDKDSTVLKTEPAVPAVRLVRDLSPMDLHELGRSEHFDIVLCLSLLHHLGGNWREFLAGVFSLGKDVVLEYPTPKDTSCWGRLHVPEQFELLEALEGKVLGDFTSFHGHVGGRRMKYIRTGKQYVDNGAFYYHRQIRRPLQAKQHKVITGFTHKWIDKQGGPCTEWIHGINLWSFLTLGGGSPSRKQIADMVYEPKEQHGDIRPWNMVLDGKAVHYIDKRDPKSYHSGDRRSIEECIAWLLGIGGIA